MGEGEEIVGIAGHLDIVPVGGDWTYDPFKLTREGDYVYGRGTTDDKGPVLEALYAMKLLRDSGVKLNKRVRLIMGCNEETGSKCMEHYNEVAEELSCGFTPDASFPCIHGEKGMVHDDGVFQEHEDHLHERRFCLKRCMRFLQYSRSVQKRTEGQDWKLHLQRQNFRNIK